jgi:2-dehydro-3-deoxyphosphogluconate aldolase/(4S)-4-hydroxy-2-oxoglutarate aldolase
LNERAATVVEQFRACRILAIATLDEPAAASEVAAALLAGGLACLEITFRRRGAAEAIRAAREAGPMLVGAGTVLSTAQADEAVAATADFAVAPATNDRVIRHCQQLGMPFFPGVATPTEIDHAAGLGLSVVKVFPAAQVGGPGFHKAVGATYPDMGFIPTGGITAENLSDYLAVLRSVRGWRRVQRRARAEAVLRDEVGARHVARRQSHRPSDRRLDLSRRCRPSAPSPGALRRCRAFRAERSELHRTGLRRPRRSWLFRPREYGCRSDVGRRGRLGSDLRHRRSPGLEILDRVGGGDSFASGFFYGLMNEYSVDEALAYGVAHGALAMTTPGDTSMATLEEVERLRRGASPRVQRCGATVGRVAVSRAARTARVRSRKN